MLRRVSIKPLSALVAAVALALTFVLSWASAASDHRSEARLIESEVRQAGTAVSVAVSSVQTKLADDLRFAQINRDPTAFDRYVRGQASVTGGFTGISLWKKLPSGPVELAHVGDLELVSSTAQKAFVRRLRPTDLLQVLGVLSGARPALAYAQTSPGDPELFVYAEAALPPRHHLVVPRSSPFGNLNFALFLGPRARQSQLLETSAPLPISQPNSSDTIAFGDSFLTIEATPTRHLTGFLPAALPWIVIGVGVLLSLLSAGAVEYVLRRRAHAELLAEQNAQLYFDQRKIAETLQHALLPTLPDIEGIEVAARYLGGTIGIEVGGDWYDIVRTSSRRCVFMVGDVSGRGLEAATTMAFLRYASRAFITEGHSIEAVLSKLDEVLALEDSTQFATVLIGEVDAMAKRVRLACAGHFPPLLVQGDEVEYAPLPASLPLGIKPDTERAATEIDLVRGSSLVAFTDGLIERRGEHLDEGLRRLRSLIATELGSIEDIVDKTISALVPRGGRDDVVVLGLRWLGGEPAS